MENAYNTPDFILAGYMEGCLEAWNAATQQRETWYGRDAAPSETVVLDNPEAGPISDFATVIAARLLPLNSPHIPPVADAIRSSFKEGIALGREERDESEAND